MRRDQPEFLEETYDTAAKYLEPVPRSIRKLFRRSWVLLE